MTEVKILVKRNMELYSRKQNNCGYCSSGKGLLYLAGSYYLMVENGSKLYYQLECGNCFSPKVLENDLPKQKYNEIFW